MAISYTKPTINTTPPEPPINKAEADRIRAANDAKIQAVADAADSLVTDANKITKTVLATGFSLAGGTSSKTLTVSETGDTVNITTAAGKAAADAIGASEGSTAGAKVASIQSGNIKFTTEGGLAIKLTNKTGAASVKGTIVNVYTASAVDNAFALCAAETLDCIGAVYEAGVADGSAAWVVVSGIAQVLFKAATTRGQVARTPVNADSGEAAGYAMPMTVPSNPNVLTEDHFREIGHILESKDADTLCKIVMHFN